jgi:hypothetical protein
MMFLRPSNPDISDVRFTGLNLEGFLLKRRWDLHDDRGFQGVYYRNDDAGAMLTTWWQTGKYRTKLDRGSHLGGQNNQMFGPKDDAGRRVIEDIMTVARRTYGPTRTIATPTGTR